MNNTLSNLNLELDKGFEQENTLYDLYQLISTYNKLLLKAGNDLKKTNKIIKKIFIVMIATKNLLQNYFQVLLKMNYCI